MNAANDLYALNPELIALLTRTLRDATHRLAVAMLPYNRDRDTARSLHRLFPKETAVPNPVIQNLIDQVTATKTVIDSAVTLINGIADRIATAVADAVANGATEAELAPLNDLVTELKAEDDALAKAIQDNTPAAPPAPPVVTAKKP